MVTVKYKVESRKFFVNKNNGQISVKLSSKKIKKILGVKDVVAAHRLIDPVVAVVYFNKKEYAAPNDITEEEEFEGEEGMDFGFFKNN